MRQKSFSFSSTVFPNRVFFASSAIMLTLISLDNTRAWGNTIEIPGLAIARFALPSISANADVINPTGTPIGAKTIELKKILHGLENDTASMIQSTRELYDVTIADVNHYYLAVGAIESRLQLGTTPANPNLIELRNNALHQLDQIAGNISMMNGLTAGFSKDAEQAKILSSHIDATLRLPGAIDEDHAHLILISEELARVDGAITRSIGIINTNTQRQSAWLDAERIRFANLSSAIDRGHNLTLLQSSASKLPYPKPILPDVEPQPRKTMAAHSHKKKVEKISERKIQSPPPSSQPLSLAPLHIAPEDETKEEHESIHPVSLSLAPLHVAPEGETKQELSESLNPVSLDIQTPEKSLSPVAVAPHPKVQPLLEEENPPETSQKQTEPSETISYSSTAKGRSALALLNSNQDPRSQKWYLFSSAKRGIKGPSDVIEIVTIEGGNEPSKLGEDVKSLLIEMGLKPEQLRLIHTKGTEEQAGQVYIFKK